MPKCNILHKDDDRDSDLLIDMRAMEPNQIGYIVDLCGEKYTGLCVGDLVRRNCVSDVWGLAIIENISRCGDNNFWIANNCVFEIKVRLLAPGETVTLEFSND